MYLASWPSHPVLPLLRIPSPPAVYQPSPGLYLCPPRWATNFYFPSLQYPLLFPSLSLSPFCIALVSPFSLQPSSSLSRRGCFYGDWSFSWVLGHTARWQCRVLLGVVPDILFLRDFSLRSDALVYLGCRTRRFRTPISVSSTSVLKSRREYWEIEKLNVNFQDDLKKSKSLQQNFNHAI